MKTIFNIFKFLISALLLWISINLFIPPQQSDSIEKDHELIQRLNFLEYELKENELGERMQYLFPEGFIFINALYGLSWCEVYQKTDDNKLKQRAYKEALFAFKEVNSPRGKLVFSQNLTPEYGIYYKSWSNYLLSKIIGCKGFKNSPIGLQEIYDLNCDEISYAFQTSTSPYLESYSSQAWPGDNFVAVASLKNAPQNQYESFMKSWIQKVKSKLDPYTKMVPHSYDVEGDSLTERARGCSSSLSLLFASDIDSTFALNQAKQYTKLFLFSRLGLPAIREYPDGKSGDGDIDSGPVIFDVGFASTIVGIGTLNKLGYQEVSNDLYNTVSAFGFESGFSQKKVLGGIMPMGDAFLTWARLQSPTFNLPKNNSASFSNIWFYSFSFLLISTFYFSQLKRLYNYLINQ